MKNLKKTLFKLHNNKYRNSLSDFKNLNIRYFKERDKFYKDIKNLNFKNIVSKDKILLKLEKYVYNKQYKNIMIYYHKFNIFLNLKSNYCYHRANTNKDANMKTILYLCKFVSGSNIINIFQELNFLLKVNDLFIIKYNTETIDNEIKKVALFLYKKETAILKKLSSE